MKKSEKLSVASGIGLLVVAALFLVALLLQLLPFGGTRAVPVFSGIGSLLFGAYGYSSLLIPAFFFALQHSFIPTLFDVRYIIYRFLSFLPLTIILCHNYYKKRNPLPIMIGHAVIDVFTVAQILMTSAIPGFYEMMTDFVRIVK